MMTYNLEEAQEVLIFIQQMITKVILYYIKKYLKIINKLKM